MSTNFTVQVANESVFFLVEQYLVYDIFAKLTSIYLEEMAVPTMPCTFEFSRGHGTGVAEALGNWGFSNRTCSAGQELRRLKCLFAEMDSL